MGDGIDAYRYPALFAEGGGLFAEFFVGSGHEVVPAQQGDLALLGQRRRPSQR